jgi:hypothetical protein
LAVFAAVVVATAASGSFGAARAAGVVGGGWQGTLTLSKFPCPGGGLCGGWFNGSLAGTATGVDGTGNPFVVIWPDPTNLASVNNLSATFTYVEQCPIGATGTAGGGFTLSGGYVNDGGVVSHDGTLTGSFGWLRVGAAVIVQTAGAALAGGGKTLATEQLPFGVGTGVFVPESLPSTCANIQSITAQVAGNFGSA